MLIILSLIFSLVIPVLVLGVPVIAFVQWSLRRRLKALHADLDQTNTRFAAIEAALERTRDEVAALRGLPGPGDQQLPSASDAPTEAPPERPATGTEHPEPPPEAAPEQQPPPQVEGPEPATPSAVPPVGPATGWPSPDFDAHPPSGTAAAPESLEQQLGTRWAVYIGGVAMALGGIFLVKHAIDAGLITPLMRVVLGFLFGFVLIATGAWMNAREHRAAGPSDQPPTTHEAAWHAAHIPSVLTAAGTIALFASGYVAYAVYALIGPTIAFVVLGVIAIATLLSAALMGPMLAGLGVAGSYVTPLLVSTAAPNPWALVVYLAIVAAAAIVLARVRHWIWLVIATVVGAVGWGLEIKTFADLAFSWAPAMTGERQEFQTVNVWLQAAMLHTLLQTGLAAALLGIEPDLGRGESQQPSATAPDGVAVLSLTALGLLAVIILLVPLLPGWFSSWLIFACLMVGVLLVTAAISVPVAAAASIGGAIALTALAAWPGIAGPHPSAFWPGVANVLRFPDMVTAFAVFGVGASAATLAIAWWRLDRPGALHAATAGFYALAATATPLLALIIAYLRITQFGTAISFTAIAAGLALIFAWAANAFQRNEPADANLAARLPTGAFAAAAIAALSIALVAGLQRGYLTVAFALAALGTSYVATRKDISTLRYAAGALGLVVLARVIWDPRIMGADVGTWPILNWLLLGYGVPAVSFWLSADLLRARSDDGPSRLMEALAVLFAALLAFWQLRHWLYGREFYLPTSTHVEVGLLALLALGFTHVLQRLGTVRSSPVLNVAALLGAALAAVLVVLGLGIAYNPLFQASERVLGGVPLSSLVPAYLLPGLMALYIARHDRNLHPPIFIVGIAVLALVLIFAYVTLEIRHAFQGERLVYWLGATSAELWVYTVAWLALSIVFLAYGLLRASLPARAASGVLLAITVIKVGLIDLDDVQGLWRALSFICLGVVLIGIGLVYQRLVFGHSRDRAPL